MQTNKAGTAGRQVEWEGGEECRPQAVQNTESDKDRHFVSESNGKLLVVFAWYSQG